MLELNKEKFQIIGCENEDAEAILRPNITYWQDAWRRLKQNKLAMFSMAILMIIVLMTIIGPYLTKYKFDEQFTNISNQRPSAEHWFGTDQLGRDMFARTWVGGRISIAIGIIGTIIEVIVGCIYGGISGYYGGLVDDIMMRIVEVINSIPYLIVVILVSVVLGQGLGSLIIALVITGWVGIARIIRGQVMQLKESEYVLAAQALGSDPGRIITRHLIPNTIGVLIVYVTFSIPGFIFAEAFLSFIGLGVQPPMTSWGAMAAFGQTVFEFYPHELFFPAAAICLTMIAFNLLGDGLRDALDPKLRQ
ncbi:ABC transporter permease [Fonticella tunisiensis]|uniref:Oligopeptide transport system permease protein n=1 Tax=Fonticella tunisiensis TaxID=1096341 RepID=A0A4R7KQV0_9CLOT|nr:ABC transporter permease [Fonticella tunisiensis]TDT61064.1 oligopeptide transport system permease protein [Fonticella tunisiensis]